MFSVASPSGNGSALVHTSRRLFSRAAGMLALLPLYGLLVACAGVASPVRNYEAVYSKARLETPPPDPARLAQLNPTLVARGRYLVEITGCAGCHTDGALVGEPDAARMLAGSHLGIAFTDPFRDINPGVVY